MIVNSSPMQWSAYPYCRIYSCRDRYLVSQWTVYSLYVHVMWHLCAIYVLVYCMYINRRTVCQVILVSYCIYRRTMFKELTKLYPTHACKEYNHNFPLFVENCGYRQVGNDHIVISIISVLYCWVIVKIIFHNWKLFLSFLRNALGSNLGRWLVYYHHGTFWLVQRFVFSIQLST